MDLLHGINKIIILKLQKTHAVTQYIHTRHLDKVKWCFFIFFSHLNVGKVGVQIFHSYVMKCIFFPPPHPAPERGSNGQNIDSS